MLLASLKFKTKTLKIISLTLTLTGIIFILGSRHIGNFAIRAAMLMVLSFCFINVKMTYRYMKTREKINYLAAVSASVLGWFKPELVMFIIGILLMFLTVPVYFNAIRNRDYSDIVMLVASGTGILFGAYCILNSRAALNTVVVIIGIVLTIAGCLALYEVLYAGNEVNDVVLEEDADYKFEDNSDV
ncbi:MAG: hypothetical protein AAGU76_16010 [Sedimentibacter sp.]|uniref:hypothetical protein n=1 Tax=Sedimentibacter sp. TaxID=1960295 RepID=UPI003158F67C